MYSTKLDVYLPTKLFLIKDQKSHAEFLRLHAPQIFLKLKGPPHLTVSQGWYMN